MKILGIDASLTSTGLCILENGAVENTGLIRTYDLRGMSRLRYIADKLQVCIGLYEPDFIVIEGYAMGIRGGRVFDIGEMGGVMKAVIYNKKIEAIIVAPTSMKKFITEKGNAKKAQIRDSLLLNWDIDTDQEDIADAIGLALFGHYLKNKRLQRSVSVNKREALQKYIILE